MVSVDILAQAAILAEVERSLASVSPTDARLMAAFSVLARVLALAAVAEAGIYPDGHWDHSTELSTDNADSFVKENVDKGKTVFIRWIASEG